MAVDWYWTDSIEVAGRTYRDPTTKEPYMVNLNLNVYSYRDSTGAWVRPDTTDGGVTIENAFAHEGIHVAGVWDESDSVLLDLQGCFGLFIG